MPFQFKIIIVAIVSYFLGNISPAILVGRLHGIDIRKEGSGNAGKFFHGGCSFLFHGFSRVVSSHP